MNTNFTTLLLGGDLRTLKKNSAVIQRVRDQDSFDELFVLMFHHERALAMRAADAVEKITATHPEYLELHRKQLLSLLKSADHKELKWHVAQLVSRITLSDKDREDVWHMLTYWALNSNESKIVRVNSLQGLFDISRQVPSLRKDFEKTLNSLEHELIPSLQARIRKLKKTE